MTDDTKKIISDALVSKNITIEQINNKNIFVHKLQKIGIRTLNSTFLSAFNQSETDLNEYLLMATDFSSTIADHTNKLKEIAVTNKAAKSLELANTNQQHVQQKPDLMVLVDSTLYVKSANGDYSQKAVHQCKSYINNCMAGVKDYDFDAFCEQSYQYYTTYPIVKAIEKVAGCPSQVNREDKYLIKTGYRFPLTGETDNCPAFKELIDQCFGEEQKPYILSWLHRSLTNLKDSQYLRGHIIYLVGEANSCKTLLLNLITLLTGDHDHANVRDTLMGLSNNFNSDLFDCCILSCDDKEAPKQCDLSTYATNIKSFSATIGARMERKGVDPITLKPKWRVIFCMNNSMESTIMLPPINESTQDKVCVFYLNKPTLSIEKYKNLKDPKEDIESIFYKELPNIRKYLLDYKVPEHIIDSDSMRFGFKSYLTNKVEYSAHINKKSIELADILSEIKNPNIGELHFTTGQFFNQLIESGQQRRSGVNKSTELAYLFEELIKLESSPNLSREYNAHKKQWLYILKLSENKHAYNLQTLVDHCKMEARNLQTTYNVVFNSFNNSTLAKII